jgi:hypothetical protein
MSASLKPTTVMTSYPAINFETVHYAVPRFVVDVIIDNLKKLDCQQ